MSDTLSENYSKLNKRYQEIKNQLASLEAKLAESEKSKESYRLQNEHHHLQLLQFYSRLGVEAFGADIHEKALETLMIMKEELEEKNGVRRALSACNHQNDEFADMIKKLVNEKEQLKQQLAITEKALELACKEITGSCEYCSYKTRIECPVEADCLDEKINYFKSQAKEMLENE